jgi:hypothetical protein
MNENKKKPWRKMLKVHPAADAFPMMSDAEIAQLANDIEQNELNDGITLWTPEEWFNRRNTKLPKEYYLLDGRNRLSAIELLQKRDGRDLSYYVDPRLSRRDRARMLSGAHGCDPYDHVISANLKRRHLDASQRAMIAAKLSTMRQGQRTDLQRTDLPPQGERLLSQPEAAKLLNVGANTVGRAKAVLDKGAPNVIAGVESGAIPVAVAARVVSVMPKAEQASLTPDEIKSAAKVAPPVPKAVIAQRPLSPAPVPAPQPVIRPDHTLTLWRFVLDFFVRNSAPPDKIDHLQKLVTLTYSELNQKAFARALSEQSLPKSA